MITNIQIVTNNAEILTALIVERATLAQQTDFDSPEQIDALTEISKQIKEAIRHIDYHTGAMVAEAMQ